MDRLEELVRKFAELEILIRINTPEDGLTYKVEQNELLRELRTIRYQSKEFPNMTLSEIEDLRQEVIAMRDPVAPNIIAAIKAVRTKTKMGLKEAKDFVDEAWGTKKRY